MFPCRLMKFSTSSKRMRTGASAAANMSPSALVPGGDVLAVAPRASTPFSPAICRATSIQGFSIPSLGSQALPTNVATLTPSGTVVPDALRRSPTPVRLPASLPARAMWYRLVRVWVLPPPNWVMRDSTGAALSVRPDSRRSTVPVCSVRDWVK